MTKKPTDNDTSTLGGKVLEFRPTAKSKPDQTALKMLKIADEIDAVIVKHLESGDIEVRDLVGLLSHRLGTLMRNVEGKEKLLPVCLDVVTKQASSD